MIVTAIVGVLAGAAMHAPPITVDIPLKLHKFTAEESQGMPQSMGFYSISPETKWSENISLPAEYAKSIKTYIYFHSQPTYVAGILDAKNNHFSKMWVDWNDDKKYQKSEVATYTGPYSGSDSQYYGLGYKKAPKGLKGPIYARLYVYKTQDFGVAPTAYMAGTTNIAGSNRIVQLFDSNYSGAFGDKEQMEADMVKIIDPQGNVNADSQSRELPLDNLFALDDGHYYTARYASSGKAVLSITQDQTPLGKIGIEGGIAQSISLRSDKSSFAPIVKDGVASVPEGKYSLAYIALLSKTKEGKQYYRAYRVNDSSRVEVKANETTNLDFDGPVELTVTQSDAGLAKQFNLTCNTKSGYTVTGLYIVENGNYNQIQAPQLVIIDPEGKEISTQAFKFG
jgi:hypothetical protein